ncbi:MAG: DUF3747 domain-containing protein [Cyanobacteriota bacterium]|nr:DUF3747 domain-containing protein [Cyanobacteriota bacterium]
MSGVLTPPLSRHGRRVGCFSLGVVASLLSGLGGTPAAAQALFGAGEVDQGRFLLVAAPIGSTGERYQLNIYEQLKAIRPCFAVGEGKPAAVNPLLSTFDFTGICGRFIDANGYSLRIGGSDLATSYRLSVVREGQDVLLVARPTKSTGLGEMVVARAGGLGSGFMKLELEPGWRLMRRQFGGRSLGHVYVYSDSVPGSTAAQPSNGPAPAQPAAAQVTSAPSGATPSGAAQAPAP